MVTPCPRGSCRGEPNTDTILVGLRNPQSTMGRQAFHQPLLSRKRKLLRGMACAGHGELLQDGGKGTRVEERQKTRQFSEKWGRGVKAHKTISYVSSMEGHPGLHTIFTLRLL